MNTVEIPESEAAHWGRQPQPPPDSVRSSWDPRQKKEWKARGSTEKERRRGLAFLPHPDSSSAHHLRNLPARDSWHPLLPPQKGEKPPRHFRPRQRVSAPEHSAGGRFVREQKNACQSGRAPGNKGEPLFGDLETLFFFP